MTHHPWIAALETVICIPAAYGATPELGWWKCGPMIQSGVAKRVVAGPPKAQLSLLVNCMVIIDLLPVWCSALAAIRLLYYHSAPQSLCLYLSCLTDCK